LNLTQIPLLDHHCHALRRPGAPLDGPAFRRHFSESRDPAMAEHVPFSLFYRRGLRDLAVLFGCESIEEAVLAARDSGPTEQHARRLIEAANISAMLVDTGFLAAENYRLEEERALLPCPVYEVLRLESLVEQLIPATNGFAQFEEAYRASLADARARGILAFKSIAAYRGGLEVAPRSRAEAEAAYRPLRSEAQRAGRVRLEARPLLEYALRVGLEAAAAQELPVQFHTGFGDDDADLRTANPLHLRPLLRDRSLRAAPIVLLHCWPYCREAGYLAGIYAHVYADLSLAIPFTAHGGAAAIRMVLEQAPTSKVLLSTDAFSIPEIFYLGALHARESLATAFAQLQAEGWLTAGQAEKAARQMLHENAARIYGVAS
jgi:predicted TIM-barrel fold metal-dependent hydrolase